MKLRYGAIYHTDKSAIHPSVALSRLIRFHLSRPLYILILFLNAPIQKRNNHFRAKTKTDTSAGLLEGPDGSAPACRADL